MKRDSAVIGVVGGAGPAGIEGQSLPAHGGAVNGGIARESDVAGNAVADTRTVAGEDGNVGVQGQILVNGHGGAIAVVRRKTSRDTIAADRGDIAAEKDASRGVIGVEGDGARVSADGAIANRIRAVTARSIDRREGQVTAAGFDRDHTADTAIERCKGTWSNNSITTCRCDSSDDGISIAGESDRTAGSARAADKNISRIPAVSGNVANGETGIS